MSILFEGYQKSDIVPPPFVKIVGSQFMICGIAGEHVKVSLSRFMVDLCL